jgi:hypothetical protein
MPAETLSRSDARKRFDKLTADIHDALSRGDRVKLRELAAEREALGSALFPGSSGPTPDQQKVI